MPTSAMERSLKLSKKNPRSSLNTRGSRMKTSGKEVGSLLTLLAILDAAFTAFISEYLFPQQLQQIGSVAVVLHCRPDLFHLCGRDVAGAVGDLFRTRHH